ncbi:hypothetical protein [Actinoplanes sp. NPDC049681]|uniref:hypothetical protein n=1 Tax=Actinoplanes sp. NPDC049681 TaxID=3363905 RepID=UPI0037B3FE2A
MGAGPARAMLFVAGLLAWMAGGVLGAVAAYRSRVLPLPLAVALGPSLPLTMALGYAGPFVEAAGFLARRD